MLSALNREKKCGGKKPEHDDDDDNDNGESGRILCQKYTKYIIEWNVFFFSVTKFGFVFVFYAKDTVSEIERQIEL